MLRKSVQHGVLFCSGLKGVANMSKIWYLSPSSQSGNIGAADYGSEKMQMTLLTDEIVPHLDRAGVSFHRADEALTLAQRVKESNDMGATFHLALHSNAGGNGKARGPVAFYYSAVGKDIAEKTVAALLESGQENNRAQNVQQGKFLYELRHTKAPACLLEVDFHDNPEGVEFLTSRRSDIAKAIAKVIIEADGKEFVPETDGEYLDRAVKLGLFPRNTSWSSPLTREEAAILMVKLYDLLKRG